MTDLNPCESSGQQTTAAGAKTHILTFDQPVASIDVADGVRIGTTMACGIELDKDLNIIRRGIAGITLTLHPLTTDPGIDVPVRHTVVVNFDNLEQITVLEDALATARHRARELDTELHAHATFLKPFWSRSDG